MPFLEAKARQESLVAAYEKDPKLRNKLFSEETFLGMGIQHPASISIKTL